MLIKNNSARYYIALSKRPLQLLLLFASAEVRTEGFFFFEGVSRDIWKRILGKVRIFGKRSGGGGGGGIQEVHEREDQGERGQEVQEGRSRRGSVWRAWGYRIWKRE